MRKKVVIISVFGLKSLRRGALDEPHKRQRPSIFNLPRMDSESFKTKTNLSQLWVLQPQVLAATMTFVAASMLTPWQLFQSICHYASAQAFVMF
jgi:hypothetical protein